MKKSQKLSHQLQSKLNIASSSLLKTMESRHLSMLLSWPLQLLMLVTLSLSLLMTATGQSSSVTSAPATTTPCASGQVRNSNGVCKLMPICPKTCTFNKSASVADQCWTYQKIVQIGTDPKTGKPIMDGEVVGYSTQLVNGNKCAWERRVSSTATWHNELHYPASTDTTGTVNTTEPKK